MSQYKSHPITIALEALTPVFAPSFTLRSVRDDENKALKYPLIDYVIIGGQGSTYDNSKNQWRQSFFMQLDILIQETRPLCWTSFNELKDAQDRQSLYWLFEGMVQQFITLLINPSVVSNLLNTSDMIYSKFDFKLENFIASSYQNKHGVDKLTGISTQFVISAISEEGNACCLINNSNIKQLVELQNLTKLNSTSWKKIEALINP